MQDFGTHLLSQTAVNELLKLVQFMQPSGHVILSADHDLHLCLSLLSVRYHTGLGTFGMTASRETFMIYMHDFKYDCAHYCALYAMLTRHTISVSFGLGQ